MLSQIIRVSSGKTFQVISKQSLRACSISSSSSLVSNALPSTHAGTEESKRMTRTPVSAVSVRSFSSDGFLGAQVQEEEVDEDEQTKDSNPTGFDGQKPIEDFNISFKTQKNLQNAGITHLFPVQTQSYDIMMEGKDILGRSKTGSGKTLAFALPLVEKLLAEPNQSRDPQVLILLPTRELAQQVADEVKRIAPRSRLANIVGGVSYTFQEKMLRRGVDIVVGTPGRIQDLLNKGELALSNVKYCVLDEADMMLKFGFQEAVESLLEQTSEDRQCVMWSATFPKWVNAMAKKFLNEPVNIDLVGNDETHVPKTVAHKAVYAPEQQRLKVLETLLDEHAAGGQSLIFTETKHEADEIAHAIGSEISRALHGDLSQQMRSSTMKGFRDGSVKNLICTDIAARGLDISSVDLVIQYRLPNDKENFVHRAGRTGRAGRSGTNIVIFDRKDVGDIKDLERKYKVTFQHTAAPGPEDILARNVDKVGEKLATVPPQSAKMFEKAAQELFDEQGVSALSSALAYISGFDRGMLQPFSMLNGRPRFTTVVVNGQGSVRDYKRQLSSFIDESRGNKAHFIEDSLVFDIPSNQYEDLKEHCAARDLEVNVAKEFPHLLVSESRNSGSRWGRNDRNSSSRGNQRRSRSNSNYSNKNRSRNGSKNHDREFSFNGRNRRNNNNSNSRNNNDRGFGRYF